jgi:hypothetical protein
MMGRTKDFIESLDFYISAVLKQQRENYGFCTNKQKLE